MKPIYQRALRLAVPMMIQNGITNAVGLVDNVMVGSQGTEAMTAVSIVGQLIFVFNLAIFGGISGPGIYGAQFYGQGNEEGFRHTVRLKYWISLVCLLVGTGIFYFLGENLIGLYLSGEGTSMDKALTLSLGQDYMWIMLFGLPPFALTQVYASSLRETGESIKPMVAGVASVVVDIVFNYLLIYGKGPFPRLGVKGAALATVLARIVEMGIVILWTHRKKQEHSFIIGLYKTMRVPSALTKSVLKTGTPIFVNEFFWAGNIAVLTQCYSRRGLEVIAGMNISNALCNLLNVVFIALGSAVGVLIGQLLGESKFQQAKEDAVRLMWFSGGLSAILMVILIALSGVFPKAYDTTNEVRHLGTMFIIITAAYFPVQGFLNALYFTIRSGGKTIITFLFDSVYSWVITVPLAAILCFFTDLSIYIIYIVVQSLDFIKLLVGYVLYKKEIWITNLAEESIHESSGTVTK